MNTERFLQHLKQFRLLWVRRPNGLTFVYDGKDMWFRLDSQDKWLISMTLKDLSEFHPVFYEDFKEEVQ